MQHQRQSPSQSQSLPTPRSTRYLNTASRTLLAILALALALPTALGAQQMMFFAFRRKIQGDQGAILLRVVDPFEMMRFRVRTGDGAVLQVTERDPRSRMVFLGYQYNFGRPARVRQVIPEQTGGGSIGFGTP